MAFPAITDFAGQQYGRLTVLYPVKDPERGKMWMCLCVCGKTKLVLRGNLIKGLTKSCGCTQYRRASRQSRLHKKEYTVWQGMIWRCDSKSMERYPRYGGRGILVCDQWRYDFDRFLKDMGPRPSDEHTIERRDNDKGYSPGNCRWATRTENTNNRSVTRMVVIDGKRMPLADACRMLGLKRWTVQSRICRKWPKDQWFLPTGNKPINPMTRGIISSLKNKGLNLVQTALASGLSESTVRNRIIRGWPEERWFEPTKTTTGIVRQLQRW